MQSPFKMHGGELPAGTRIEFLFAGELRCGVIQNAHRMGYAAYTVYFDLPGAAEDSDRAVTQIHEKGILSVL